MFAEKIVPSPSCLLNTFQVQKELDKGLQVSWTAEQGVPNYPGFHSFYGKNVELPPRMVDSQYLETSRSLEESGVWWRHHWQYDTIFRKKSVVISVVSNSCQKLWFPAIPRQNWLHFWVFPRNDVTLLQTVIFSFVFIPARWLEYQQAA